MNFHELLKSLAETYERDIHDVRMWVSKCSEAEAAPDWSKAVDIRRVRSADSAIAPLSASCDTLPVSLPSRHTDNALIGRATSLRTSLPSSVATISTKRSMYSAVSFSGATATYPIQRVSDVSIDDRCLGASGFDGSNSGSWSIAPVSLLQDWRLLACELAMVQKKRTTARLSRFSAMSTASIQNTCAGRILKAVQGKIRIVTTHRLFETCCICAILLNTLTLAISTHTIASDRTDPQDLPVVLRVIDYICSGWFLLELLARMASGVLEFFCSWQWYWNMLDMVIVISDMLELGLKYGFGDDRATLSQLAVLRVLRLFRVMRVIRLLQFCSDLQVLVKSVFKCGRSLLWSQMLLALVIFIFSMVIMTVVSETADGPHEKVLRKMWGSLPKAFYTLFLTMSGGISWREVADPLLAIHWIMGLVLMFFVFFTLFIYTNIVTAIFIDTAMMTTTADREEIIHQQLLERDAGLLEMRNIFEEADTDKSGHITYPELVKYVEDPRVRAYLRSMGLDIHEAQSLFRLLCKGEDSNGNEGIALADFIFGCMRLRGPARSIDLMMVIHETKQLMKLVGRMRKDLRDIRSAYGYGSSKESRGGHAENGSLRTSQIILSEVRNHNMGESGESKDVPVVLHLPSVEESKGTVRDGSQTTTSENSLSGRDSFYITTNAAI